MFAMKFVFIFQQITFLLSRADSSVSENDVPAESNGLSEFGRLVVKEMNRLGNDKSKKKQNKKI
jgi:hypothetical protein